MNRLTGKCLSWTYLFIFSLSIYWALECWRSYKHLFNARFLYLPLALLCFYFLLLISERKIFLKRRIKVHLAETSGRTLYIILDRSVSSTSSVSALTLKTHIATYPCCIPQGIFQMAISRYISDPDKKDLLLQLLQWMPGQGYIVDSSTRNLILKNSHLFGRQQIAEMLSKQHMISKASKSATDK